MRIFFSLLLISSLSSLAWAEDRTPITHLHVGQEISRTNGVLVSRPQPTHEEIVKIITRNKIQSLEDYTRWLKTTIRYQTDGETDTWSQPKETLHNQAGDCEDYALLNATVIEVLGYKPHFLALVRKGQRAHAICTFKHNGYFLWFDNDRLIKTTMTSIEQLARDLTTSYDYSALLEYDLKSKKWDVLYNKFEAYANRPSVSPQVTLSSP
jgi:predicted transglutaminase-like cysteine proteinase